jgi:hypothetical protein
MKRYFYSIYSKTGKSWSQENQFSVEFETWAEFTYFCKQIARSQKTEVRGCETSGTDNQGYYFHFQNC